MKKYTCFLAIPISLVIMQSCINKEHLSKSRMDKYGMPYSTTWQDTLLPLEKKSKESWLNYIGHDAKKLEREGLYLSAEEFSNLEYVPIMNYTIDSSSFSNFNESVPVKKIIKTNRQVSELEVYKDGLLVINIRTKLTNGRIDGFSYGRVGEGASKKISELKKNKVPIFTIGVDYRPGYNDLIRYTVFMDKNGELMNLTIFGTINSFKEELITLRKSLSSYQK